MAVSFGFRMNDLIQTGSMRAHDFPSSKRVLDPPIGITRRVTVPQIRLSVGRMETKLRPLHQPFINPPRAYSTADLIRDISVPGRVKRGCSACGRG